MARTIEEELELIGALGGGRSFFSPRLPAVTLTEDDRILIRRTVNEVRMKMKIAETALSEVSVLLEALDQFVQLTPRVEDAPKVEETPSPPPQQEAANHDSQVQEES